MLIKRPPASDRRILAKYLFLPEVPKARHDLIFEVPEAIGREEATRMTESLISLLDVLGYSFVWQGNQSVALPPERPKKPR